MAEYSTEEKTKAQVLIGGDTEELTADSTTSGNFYKTVRAMRRHPTVALARELVVAPLLAAPWSVEEKDGAPDGAKEFIDGVMQPLRIHLLRSSLFGCIDFGFQPYEKLFKVDELTGLLTVSKVKPLLQDNTKILIDIANGSFLGFKQGDIRLELPESLLVNIDVEGTYWYGEPKMKVVETAYNNWNYCNDAAVRYDKKLAGAHWIIHYPLGKTTIDGVETDNFDIAKRVLSQLQSSGQIVVPRTVEDMIRDANEQAGGDTAWKIELLSAYPTSNVAFIDRLKYLDAMMARAMGMPERAVLEGQFGTKAESEAHADFAISNMELRHQIIVQHYNWHLVNQLLRINYGAQAENTVYVQVAPITDLAMQYLREVYKTFLANTEGFAAESNNIDTQSLRDQLGIPTLSADDKIAQDATAPANSVLSFSKLFQLARV